MKIERIQYYRNAFLDHIENKGLFQHHYRYEAQQNWQKKWDIEELKFETIYDESLNSVLSGRIWGGSQFSAKKSMMEMILVQREFMRSAFRDLFTQGKDLGLRCDRFIFYCDEAISYVKTKEVFAHRHDRALLSAYLSFQYSSEFCLFDYPYFLGMMKKLEGRNIPREMEMQRYMKSMKAIHGILIKGDRWKMVVSAALLPYYKEDSIMIMNEFSEFVSHFD